MFRSVNLTSRPNSIMLRLLCFICLLVNITVALDGPNTCIEEHEVPVVVKIPAKVPQEVTTYKWCAKFPPRCKTTKIVVVDGYKEEIHYEKNRTRVCCKGYAEARNKCVPVCSNACLHGRCISPEKCDCEPGYSGQNCDSKHTCPKGKKGKNCDQPCSCKNDARCDAVSGECICRPGWTGQDCTDPCPPGYHGFRCLDECRCSNNADCDPVNGRCKCKPGWKGQHCEIECTEAENGCIQGCYCDHGGYCNLTTGLCRCPPGYTGDYCSDACPYGTYGLNCAQRCNCNSGNESEPDSHVVCDHIAGCKVWSSSPLKIVESEPNGNHASATLILLIGMIIIVLIISGFLILKYRRELRLLNSELAFVTYISRKESNDRFDNPLYSYQATTPDCKPPLNNSVSPPAPPPQASSSTKASLFSGFKRNFETNICKGSQDKSSGLPSDFLKPNLNVTSCYDDLKTTKREYNSNIYEENDNCGTRSSTLTKEPVYAEIPGSDNKDDLKESPYDSPRPIDSNDQVNKF